MVTAILKLGLESYLAARFLVSAQQKLLPGSEKIVSEVTELLFQSSRAIPVFGARRHLSAGGRSHAHFRADRRRVGSRYDLQGHDVMRFENHVAQKVVEGLRVQFSSVEQDSLKTRPGPEIRSRMFSG